MGIFGQRLTALAIAMNVADQPSGLQLRFDLGRPIGGVGPDPGAGVAPRQQLIHRLAVVHGGIGDTISPDPLVCAIHIDVVLLDVM